MPCHPARGPDRLAALRRPHGETTVDLSDAADARVLAESAGRRHSPLRRGELADGRCRCWSGGASRPNREHRLLGELPTYVFNCCRGEPHPLLAFPGYLRDAWGLESRAEVPRHALGLALRRNRSGTASPCRRFRRREGRASRYELPELGVGARSGNATGSRRAGRGRTASPRSPRRYRRASRMTPSWRIAAAVSQASPRGPA